MTRRIRPLEVRGFSKSSFDGLHTLSEKPEDQVITPPFQKVAFDSNEVDLDLNPRKCHSPLGPLPASLPEESASTQSLSESNCWSFSGNLTGRSSVYSWGNDDEFDKQASATVKRMFEEIDSILFERTGAQGNQQLREECKEWASIFPHFRILGSQLLSPTDLGTEMIFVEKGERKSHNGSGFGDSLADVDGPASQDMINCLNICGLKLDVQRAPLGAAFSEGVLNPYTHLEEEIYALDGNVEEFFAFDSVSPSEHDDKQREKGQSRCQRHPGYPPVTPNAFFRDTLLSEIFDQLWMELVAALRNLLKIIVEKFGKVLSKDLLVNASENDHGTSSILGTLSRDGYSKIPHLPPQLRLKAVSGPLSVTSDLNGLKELMTIRSVPLQQRAPSVAALTLRDDDPLHGKEQTRPVSSTFGVGKALTGRPLSMRNSDHQLYNRLTSARSMKRNGRLQPLQPLDRSKTPALQDNHVVGEVLRGFRLQTASDRIMSPSGLSNLSPQPWGARNGMLPPIERMESVDNLSLAGNSRSPKQRGTRGGTRASSAATDETRRPNLRERTSSNVDSRPNTTHSSRSEVQHSLSRRLPSSLFGTTTITSRGGASISSGYHSNPLGVLQGVGMPVSHVHATNDSHLTAQGKSVSFDEEAEVDDLVLWGHGPPLILNHPRKGRTNVR